MRKPSTFSVLCVLLAACQPGGGANSAAGSSTDHVPPEPRPVEELIAPMSLSYSVVGSPVVGQPVGINVEVTSSLVDAPIVLTYRSAEVGSLSFPETQATTTTLAPLGGSQTRRQQFSVIPEREGRIFVVVAAEIETSAGEVIRSISVPIQVARAAVLPSEGGQESAESR